jgi:hypothetical protein
MIRRGIVLRERPRSQPRFLKDLGVNERWARIALRGAPTCCDAAKFCFADSSRSGQLIMLAGEFSLT